MASHQKMRYDGAPHLSSGAVRVPDEAPNRCGPRVSLWFISRIPKEITYETHPHPSSSPSELAGLPPRVASFGSFGCDLLTCEQESLGRQRSKIGCCLRLATNGVGDSLW